MRTLPTGLVMASVVILCACSTHSQQEQGGSTPTASLAETRTEPKQKESNMPAYCANLRLIPENNSYLDTSILSFNEKLNSCIDRKDLKTLITLLDKDVISSHGGGLAGLKDFYDYWGLNRNTDSAALWQALSAAVEPGGCYNTKEQKLKFVFPYLQSSHLFKGCSFDWFSTGVCTKEKVLVYEKPDKNSRVIDTFSYRVLDTGDELKAENNLIAVSTPDGSVSGYIDKESIYLSASYTLIIEKKNGAWKITAFAPYD